MPEGDGPITPTVGEIQQATIDYGLHLIQSKIWLVLSTCGIWRHWRGCIKTKIISVHEL